MALVLGLLAVSPAWSRTISVTHFGVHPNTHTDSTVGVLKALRSVGGQANVTLVFPRGRYDFWPEKAAKRQFFISNHDYVKSRSVVFLLEHLSNFTLDGQGSEFIFHKSIMPIAVVGCTGVTLKGFSIDYATPHIVHAKVVKTGGAWVELQLGPDQMIHVENGHIDIVAEDWKQIAKSSLEFDPKTKGVAWNTGDNWDFFKTSARQVSPGLVRVTGLQHPPKVGDVLVLWSGDRPNPAIWVSESQNTLVSNVNVYSAQGMGFIAQKSENIHLDGFNVRLRPGSPRYVSTIADAVHFSNCKGKVVVENGLFENMLDDGINVHGSYLKVIGRPSPDSVLLEFGHPQSFGFTFAAPGEHVQFVDPDTVLPYAEATVKTVKRIDDKHIELGFDRALPGRIRKNDGVVNIDWQPTVIYRHNHIRNNRARGALFSTPAGVTVEHNFFDHLSGPAILMSADCRYWFESAPSHNVVIRHNRFVDPMIGKFGDAPILIVPPWTADQNVTGYSVKNVHIEDNYFRVFQKPLLDAVSTKGLVFRNNIVEDDHDYPPNVKGDSPVFSFNHVKCIDVSGNKFPWTLTRSDIHEKDSLSVSIQGIAPPAMKGCGE